MSSKSLPPLYLLAYAVAGQEPDFLCASGRMEYFISSWLGLDDDLSYAEMFKTAVRVSATVQGLETLYLYLRTQHHIDIDINESIAAAAGAGNLTTLCHLLPALPTFPDWGSIFVGITDKACFHACLSAYEDWMKNYGLKDVGDTAWRDVARIVGGFDLDLVDNSPPLHPHVLKAYGMRGLVPPPPNDLDYLDLRDYQEGLLAGGHFDKYKPRPFETSTVMQHAAVHGNLEFIESYLADDPGRFLVPENCDWLAWEAACNGRDAVFHRFFRPESSYRPIPHKIFTDLPPRFYRFLAPAVDPAQDTSLLSRAIEHNNLALVKHLLGRMSEDRPKLPLHRRPCRADAQTIGLVLDAGFSLQFDVSRAALHLERPLLMTFLKSREPVSLPLVYFRD